MYSIYYYFFKTAMTGILQLSFYFCYMTVLRYVLGVQWIVTSPSLFLTVYACLHSVFGFSFGILVLCGTIGYFASEFFVWRIYSALKVE